VRAVVVEEFGAPPAVREVPAPVCAADGVVVRVGATGLCRSDWHGWAGHDPDIVLPHVPGHEFAGTVVVVGDGVTRARVGDRVTAPFVCACGACPTCARGDHQVCERQQQPGFTYWGSFAELVAVPAADVNLVPLPDGMEFATAAALGCRFATAHRAVVAQGGVRAGHRVLVVGGGGVGLSAAMIARAGGADVHVVDPSPVARERAAELGATTSADAGRLVGFDVSLDAIGSVDAVLGSLAALRPRGRHVQVGLLGGVTEIPAGVLGLAVARELEIVGSHGMAAHDYAAMLARVTSGELDPARLVRRRIGLDEAAAALPAMGAADGITIIEPA
jgi:alcohol dehydrogenase